jgi:hypothetical protein
MLPNFPLNILICIMSDTSKNIGTCSGRSFRNATVNGQTNERFYCLEEMEGNEMKWKEVEGKERNGCHLSEAGCVSHLKGIKLKQTNSPAGSLIKEIQLSITLRAKSYTVQHWITRQTSPVKL